jgi:hypothetical protein
MLTVALALALFHGRTLVGHVGLALDRWRFNDDVRVLIHPQFFWEDATLFPRDPSVDYFLASLPEAYRVLYRALGPLVGVAALSKALPLVLLALSLWCIGRIADRLSGLPAALGAVSLTLGSGYVLGRMVGGLPRGFALPLLAAGALCLVEGRAFGLALVAVLAAGFYPAAGLTLGAALAMFLLLPARDRGSAAGWSLKRRLAVLALTTVAAGSLVMPTAWRLHPWGAAIGPQLVAAFPEAGPGGRFEAMDRAPFPALPKAALGPLQAAIVTEGDAPVRALSLRSSGRWLAPLFVFLGLGGWAVLARRRSDVRRLLLFPVALALCHTLALVAEPLLFLPERYVAYGIPLVALLAAPTALGALRESPNAWWRAAPLVYNLLLLVALGGTGVFWTGYTVAVPKQDRALYERLATLPKNAVIAAFPNEINDTIPYLSRRSVFLAREAHMPFHAGYTAMMRGRARALFSAYFTPSVDELTKFRNEWGVTHLLVNASDFQSRPTYFAPFDPDVALAFTRGRDQGFAALNLRSRAEIFTAGGYTLLDLDRL